MERRNAEYIGVDEVYKKSKTNLSLHNKSFCNQFKYFFRENILNQPVWGGQLGSAKLWEEHRNNIQKILNVTSDDDFDSNKVTTMKYEIFLYCKATVYAIRMSERNLKNLIINKHR